MKRNILALLLSLFLIPAFSQSLTLENADGPVSDGDTVFLFLWGGLNQYLVAYMDVTNTTASPMEVMCVREELSVVSGSINYFCWDQCFDPAVDSSGIVSIAAGATNTSNFSGDYTPNNNPGTSFIRYTFYDAVNPMDAVSFVASFYGSPVSVSELVAPKVNISKVYPNPAVSNFSFDYEISSNGQPVRIIVRDILGEIIKKEILSPGEGTLTLSTEGMNKGIYFYSVLVGKEVATTHKLVIN